jgi:hypothetical protein
VNAFVVLGLAGYLASSFWRGSVTAEEASPAATL